MARSPPAEKARPAPVITDTATESSPSTTDQTSESSRCSRSLAALRTSGRSMVMSRTPAAGRSNRRCSKSLVGRGRRAVWTGRRSSLEQRVAEPELGQATGRARRGSTVDIAERPSTLKT